jgi:hypothetical protein
MTIIDKVQVISFFINTIVDDNINVSIKKEKINDDLIKFEIDGKCNCQNEDCDGKTVGKKTVYIKTDKSEQKASLQ